MFARFRNLFSKAKSETTPEKEPEPEPEPESENAENTNRCENGGIDQKRLDTNLDCTNESVSAETEISDTILKPSADQVVVAASEGQRSGQVVRVELTQITQPNVEQSNGNIVHELSTATLESKSTVDESTLEANLNKNETGESINKPENEKTEENGSASRGEAIGAAAGEETASDYGSGGLELVKVDNTEIEVNTQLAEFGEKQNVAAHANDESENKAVGEITTAAQTQNGQTSTEIGHLAINGCDIADTPAKTNNPLIDPLTEITTQQTSLADNENFQIGFSIAVGGLATDVSSPAGDTLTQYSSPDGTTASESTAESSTIIIKPTGSNDIACAAISNKLQEIAEVAESLDASIRDVQQDAEALDVSTTNTAERKREVMRSNSSEDWHSRSTEDDSFVTASEGNFTPYSHSSSYQTASGRTSSYISSDKNSFDVSEADDSPFASAYEIPADINMSFDGSEQSFVSAHQQESTPSPQHQQQEHHRQQYEIEEPSVSGAYALPPTAGEGIGDGEGEGEGEDIGDGGSIADVEELHSQSVTPTPGDGDVEQYNFQSIPVDAESDFDTSCIVDAPSIEMLTEAVPVTSVTPEVSTCSSTTQQQQQSHNNTNTTTTTPTPTPTNSNSNNSNNSQKPNAAWRRSKYYENITKQTIKGFL